MSANSTLAFFISSGLRSDETLLNRAQRALENAQCIRSRKSAITSSVHLAHFGIPTAAERLPENLAKEIKATHGNLIKKWRISQKEIAQELQNINSGDKTLNF